MPNTGRASNQRNRRRRDRRPAPAPAVPVRPRRGRPAPRRRDARADADRAGPARTRAELAPAAIGIDLGIGSPDSRVQRFSNTEAILEVNSGASLQFRVNGTNPLFKSLRAKLAAYSRYTLKRFVVRWTPSVGTGAPGEVFMSFNPDCNAVPPVTVNDFSNQRPFKTGPIWSTHELDLRPAISRSRNMSRLVDDYDAPLQPSSIEQNLYAFGEVFIKTTGSSTPAGRVWIDYVFEASNPREARDPESAAAQIHSNATLTQPFASGVTETLPGHVQATGVDTFIVRRPGTYLMTQQVVGTTVAENPTAHPTVVTYPGYDASAPPTYKKFDGSGDGDGGYWQLNTNGARATSSLLMTTTQPVILNPVGSVQSTGATNVTRYTIRFSPFSHDDFGWVDDVMTVDDGSDLGYDHCCTPDAEKPRDSGKAPASKPPPH